VTPAQAAIFFGIMLVLAALPSASVALVVSQASRGGFRHGAAAAAGIAAADVLLAGLAWGGLGLLAQTLGPFFVAVRVLAAVWLLWMGLGWLRSPGATASAGLPGASGLATSAAAGFMLTLGDLKALVFYASIFPAITDLSTLRARDFVVIAVVTFGAVGGVKLAYAAAARGLVARLSPFPHWAAAGRKLIGGALILAAASVLAGLMK
jgi:threonine/homoserine/homoserine lactone efflux protein